MLPLPDLLRALDSGELSPSEHVDDVLSRLQSDTTGCVVALDADRARERAAELTALSAAGRRLGPLHGVAVGIKDLVDVAGLPTRCGSRLLADAGPRGRRRAGGDDAAGRRGRGRREAPHPRVRLRPHRRRRGHRPGPQPARPVPDHRRLVLRSAAAVAAGHLALTVGTDTGRACGPRPRCAASPG
nr:amidase family protein [Pseudonocardia sp. ICBG601]